MRSILSLAALFLLAGCTTVSNVREAWHWNPTAPQAGLRVALSPPEAAAVSRRVAELQSQQSEIRSRIRVEPDIRMRQRLYEELHLVGRQLSRLQRQLIAAAPAVRQ